MSLLDGFDERKAYLRKRQERIQNNVGERNEKIRNVLEMMEAALLEPTERCLGGQEHEFVFLLHADGLNGAAYYFKCKQCSEVIVAANKRSDDDPMKYVEKHANLRKEGKRI